MDALQYFPDDADMIEVARSRAFLVKKDIFRNLMWYTLPDSNKQYPLTIERVKKIKELNRQGIKPEELEPAEVITGKPKEIEPVYADVVGQISLKSLEKTSRKRRDQERNQNPGRRPQDNRQGQNRNEPRAQGAQQSGGGRPQNRSAQGGQQQRPNQPGNRQQRPNPNRGGQPPRPNQQPNNKDADKK
jgi:hypothetical protein